MEPRARMAQGWFGVNPEHGAHREVRRRLWSRWDTWALVVGAASLVVRGYLLSRSWFWQDDFVIGDRALASRLDLAWVLQDYSGHLMPAQFVQTWLLVNTVGMSWPAFAAVVLAWSAAFAASFWILLRVVVGRGPAALAAFGLAVFCPLWSVSASWYASSVQTLPTLTFVTLAAAAFACLLRTGRARWGVATLVSFALALLWFEKALVGLALVALAGAAILLTGRAVPLRSKQVVATSLGLIAIAGAYVVAFVRLIGVPAAPEPGGDVARLVYEMLLSVVPTGLVGGPWQQNTDGSTLQVLVTQPWLAWIWFVVGAVLVVGLRRHRAATVIGVLAVLLVVAVDIWLVARARIDFLGPVIGRDTRYTVDVVPVAALAVAVAMAGGRRAPAPRTSPAVRRAATLAAAPVALLYAVVAWPSIFFVAESRASLGVAEWVSASVSTLAEEPSRVFVAGYVPPAVVAPAFGDGARASNVLRPFGVDGDRFDAPASEWWRLNGAGAPEPALFVPTGGGPVGSGSCGLPLRGIPLRIQVPDAPPAAGAGVRAVRISWYAATDETVVVESATGRWEVDLNGRLGYLFIALEDAGDELILGGLPVGQALCVTAVELGEAG